MDACLVALPRRKGTLGWRADTLKREVQNVLFHLVRWYHALMQTPGRANSIHAVAWKQKREKRKGPESHNHL